MRNGRNISSTSRGATKLLSASKIFFYACVCVCLSPFIFSKGSVPTQGARLSVTRAIQSLCKKSLYMYMCAHLSHAFWRDPSRKFSTTVLKRANGSIRLAAEPGPRLFGCIRDASVPLAARIAATLFSSVNASNV